MPDLTHSRRKVENRKNPPCDGDRGPFAGGLFTKEEIYALEHLKDKTLDLCHPRPAITYVSMDALPIPRLYQVDL